jgi:energy-coupling factor transporter ATP-binding protein EcfA2
MTPSAGRRWSSGRYGIILVTGPTGSGKTTTLYSTLKRVATEEVNVSTVEDPIEMIEPSFNQTQVQVQLDFGFAEGLRALMRQDPDIIMVGEIRDLADRRDGGAGGADRPPGVLHAAHQRRTVRHHASDGAGRAVLPDQRHRAGRAGAAAGAHAVQAVPRERRAVIARGARRGHQALEDQVAAIGP